MLLPVVLSVFTATLFGVAATQADFATYMFPALASAYLSLVWLVRSFRRWKPKTSLNVDAKGRRGRDTAAQPTYKVAREKAKPSRKQRQRQRRNPVIVDGSNVMHWRDGVAQAESLIAVVQKLKTMGYSPGVVFDANAGFKLAGEYRNDAELAEAIGLDEDQVLVVKSGTSADPMILHMARELKAPIVSNDRFRDWAEQWPEVAEPSNFIRGSWENDSLQLQRFSPQKSSQRKKSDDKAAAASIAQAA